MSSTVHREAMTRFVAQLYNHVFDMPEPKEAWVAAWVERGLQLNNPQKLFEQFVEQKANVERVARRDDSRTQWPHGHFYSPVVSRAEVAREWPRLSRARAPAEVDVRAAEQLGLLGVLAGYFGGIPFPEDKEDGFRYYYKNPSYAYGDALIYWSMLHYLKPKRIIEVAAGSARRWRSIRWIDWGCRPAARSSIHSRQWQRRRRRRWGQCTTSCRDGCRRSTWP